MLSWVSFWINHEATSARVALGKHRENSRCIEMFQLNASSRYNDGADDDNNQHGREKLAAKDLLR